MVANTLPDAGFETRNRGLFMLGVSTGGRISELLSLTIADVYQNRRAVTDLLFDKSIVKGGEVSRSVPVNADGRLAIETLIAWHREKYGKLDVKRPLFPSRNKSGTVPMNSWKGETHENQHGILSLSVYYHFLSKFCGVWKDELHCSA